MAKIIEKVSVINAEWNEAIESELKSVSKNITIDGFRKGKAPRDIIIKKYGMENLYVDAADKLIQDKYTEILDSKKIIPVAKPKVDIKKCDESGLEIEYTFIVAPEVKLGKYKGLGVKKKEVKVSKKDIEHEIDHLRSHYAELTPKTGKVENGDVAIIDFEGFLDGTAFDGGKGENYSLEIGSHSFIPGFEEALVGLKVNDEKDINITFPEDYHSEDLKGKDVVFKVKINDLKTKTLPELNDDFFEDLAMDGVKSKEDLEKNIEENMKAHLEVEYENEYIDELLKSAAKNIKIDIDEEIIDEEIDRMYEDFFERMAMQGITEEIYFNYTKETKEELKDKMKEEAKNRVTYRYMLESIAKNENINPTEKEVKEEAKNLAKRYNMETDHFLEHFGGLDMVEYDLKVRRALELLKNEN